MSLVHRYKDNDTGFTSSKKRMYKTILYPSIEKSYNDIYIMSNDADRLDLLADKYYGDVRYWWIIAVANFLGKGSLNVPGGLQLRIPKNLEKIQADFDQINSNR